MDFCRYEGHAVPREVTEVTSPIPERLRNPRLSPIEWGRMSLFQRYRWFAAAAGITLAFAGVSAIAQASTGLAAFADIVGLALMLAVAGTGLVNALTRPAPERGFWALLMLGFLLWSCNQAAWTYYDIVLHRQVPDPSCFDIILFFHAVPIIAAVAWRPDILKKKGEFTSAC